MKKLLLISMLSVFLVGCTLDENEDYSVEVNVPIDSEVNNVNFKTEVLGYVTEINEAFETYSILFKPDAFDNSGNKKWFLDYSDEFKKELLKMKLQPLDENDDIILDQFIRIHILAEEVNTYVKMYLNGRVKLSTVRDPMLDLKSEIKIFAELYNELY